MENGKDEAIGKEVGVMEVEAKIKSFVKGDVTYYVPIMTFTLPTKSDGMVPFEFAGSMYCEDINQVKELLANICGGIANMVKAEILPEKAGNA